MSRAIRATAALMTVFSTAVVTGCGHRLDRFLLPETRPEVHLTHLRLAPPSERTYAYLAHWSGQATGAAPDHYLYAIDPRSVDAVDARWVRTTATQQVLTFPLATDTEARHAPHVFAVRAVSASGTMSEPAWFAFTQDNLPPVVEITQPAPSPVFTPVVISPLTISWQGADPDGQSSTSLVRYTFRLFGTHNPDRPDIADWIAFALTYPDSLRAIYAPDFPGWTSVGGDTTSFQYSDLAVGSTYLFAITAFDEAGDYDPVFSSSKNLLRFGVTYPGTAGPVLTMFNQFFNYTYPTGGYFTDPSRQVRVEMPAGQPATVNWFATPMPGSEIVWYRWALGILDLTDETPRTNETTDWSHWSARSLTATSATVGPFNPPPGRSFSTLLYIEAQDSNGLRSLGIVNLVFSRATFNSELLFVDDTGLIPDFESSPRVLDPPAGPWPTAARGAGASRSGRRE